MHLSFLPAVHGRPLPLICAYRTWLPHLQFVMFFAQGALVNWRRRHKRSYDLATLVGLWLIPPIISIQLGACVCLFALTS